MYSLSFVARIVIVVVVAGSGWCAAQSASRESMGLADKVRSSLADSLGGIKTVRCVYGVEGLGRFRVATYAREGTRYRQASATARDDAGWADLADPEVVQPMESAFDGETYYNRRRVGELGVSDRNVGGLVAISPPEDFVLSIVGGPLGIDWVLGVARVTTGGGRFEVTRADVVEEGPDAGRVRLEWWNETTKRRIVAVHDLSVGGWPVSAVETDETGRVLRELKDARYSKPKEGVPAFPVSATLEVATPGSGGVQRQVLRVSESSIKINEGIEPGVFRLEAMPNDVVKRLGRGDVVRPAQEESWQPSGTVPFPWGQAWDTHKRLSPRPGVKEPGASRDGSLAGGGRAEVELASAGVGSGESMNGWSVVLLAAGGAVVLAGVVMVIRQRGAHA